MSDWVDEDLVKIVEGIMEKKKGASARPYTKERAAANARYDKKTYRDYKFRLRKVDDADIIESIETAKAKSVSYREWLRGIYENFKKD